MYNFTFHRPTGLRQAGNMLGKLEEAKILAGGQTLIPTMKLRLASPTTSSISTRSRASCPASS
jgi:carbon-monoxide dehydrogenase medium subunit